MLYNAPQDVNANTALWTAGFVVMTLVINGPLLSPLMRWLKLNEPTASQLHVRRAATKVGTCCQYGGARVVGY